MANWASVARLGDPSSADWQRKNLASIEPVPGQRWQVYQPAAKSFEGFLRDLAATGYPLTSSGGFNYRPIRGGTTLSQHAFGTAIDLNAAANPRLTPGAKVVTDLPANVAELAARHNLEWGGNWKRPDAMHFEWRGDGAPAPAGSIPAMIAEAQPAAQSPAAPQQANLSAMYGAGGAMPQTESPQQPALGQLAMLFAQQQNQRQQVRADEQAAQDARRAALFSPEGLFGIYS